MLLPSSLSPVIILRREGRTGMPELADLIEKILQQQLREEEQLRRLEIQASSTRSSIANAKEEVAQLLVALEIAVKRGMAEPIDLDALRARIAHEPQGDLFTESVQESQPPPLDFTHLVPHAGAGSEQEEEEEEEEEEPTPPVASSRSKKLIDLVWDIIQGFDFDDEFTTTDIRREMAEQYPEKFAIINPASISGTVARLHNENREQIVRVGDYADGIHYRRKAAPETKEDPEMSEEGGENDATES
jgi:hypothetical protein